MQRDRRFVARRRAAPEAIRRPDLRLTIDTPDDLEFMRKVFGLARQHAPVPTPLASLIAIAAGLAETVPMGH
jgi:spore coat polysaccharide biosynthesis protein SpsF (cytidylyltransferase family)